MTDAIPRGIRDLLNRHLATMEHVEVLLRLASDESRGWTVDEIGTLIHIAPSSVTRRADELVASGLATRTPAGGTATFQYAPGSPELREAVVSLEEMYRTKPVTLIKAIYERPAPSAVKSFADAFRVRKPEP